MFQKIVAFCWIKHLFFQGAIQFQMLGNVFLRILHPTSRNAIKKVGFRFRCIYLVILQTQETSAKTKFGRCRRGHLDRAPL